jgi:hypothetical protein
MVMRLRAEALQRAGAVKRRIGEKRFRILNSAFPAYRPRSRPWAGQAGAIRIPQLKDTVTFFKRKGGRIYGMAEIFSDFSRKDPFGIDFFEFRDQ